METININKLSLKHIKLLNDICENLKDEFHLLVESIYEETDGSLDWLVNVMLSRNNYMSKIFIDLCYIELVKKIVTKESVKLVIVSSTGQKKVLSTYFKKNNKTTLIRCSETNYNKIKSFFLPLYDYLNNIVSSLYFIMAKNHGRLSRINKTNGIKIVDIFIIKSMFKDLSVSDRYYNGIVQNLPKEEKQSLYFVPTFVSNKKLKKSINKCEISKENYLYKFDLLLFRDYFYALLSPFRIKKIDFNKFKFNDCDIGPLLKNDFYRNISNGSSFEGILNYLFFKRMKEYGLNLSVIVNWFENQVLDRGFNKGVRDYYPHVRSIGYQGFITSFDLNIHFQPSQLEYRIGVIPNQIAVIGDGLKKRIKRFCPKIEVITAPAFRYTKIYKQNSREFQSQNHQQKILVTLTANLMESFEIISLLNKVEKIGIFKNIEVKIIPHPSLDDIQIRKLKVNISNKFKFVSLSFSDVIQKCGLLISSTSSTCVESLAYGIPVIVVGSLNGVTQNPIPQNIKKTIWDVCYTVDEFKNAFQRLCINNENENEKRKNYASISKKIRDKYFIPVSKNGVCKLLGLNEYI